MTRARHLHIDEGMTNGHMKLHSKFFDELTGREVYEILSARSRVFVVEQKICCHDMDGVDLSALHLFFKEGECVTAYLRAFYTDESKRTVSIGRVLTVSHGVGTGRALMEAALPVIEEKLPCEQLVLHAQCYATGFYEKFGFEICSEPFIEEEILHVSMQKCTARKE